MKATIEVFRGGENEGKVSALFDITKQVEKPEQTRTNRMKRQQRVKWKRNGENEEWIDAHGGQVVPTEEEY